MKAFLSSKLGWIFLSIHSCLFAIGIYQRSGTFHFVSEPLALQIVALADFVWLLLADNLGLGSLSQPTAGLLFMGLMGGIQWFIIGSPIGLLLRKRKSNQFSS